MSSAPFRVVFAVGMFAASMSVSMSQVPVALQNATATFSQSGFTVDKAINGTIDGSNGWAIDPDEGASQIAAFQTVSNVGSPGGSLLTFKLTQINGASSHLLGKFRLAVTTDDRSTFADGLATGGNVTANWTVLTPSSALSQNGATLTILNHPSLDDNRSVLAGGTLPSTDIYTVTAPISLTGITGIRLEALTDASLPRGGPGRSPSNGNFVLTQFSVGIAAVLTPEPGVSAFLGAMLCGGIGFLKRRR